MDRQQLYAMNIHYRYYDLEFFFKKCHEMNFHNAEIWLCPQHFYINSVINENSAKLKKLIRQYDVAVTCLCPEQNNPKPNNIAARSQFLKETSEEYFKKVIDLARDIGCELIVVTPGWNYHDETVEEARDRSVVMLQKLCDYAGKYKINLAMESIWQKSSAIANTKEKVKELKDLVNRNNFKLTIDLGALSDVGETPQEWFELFGKDIVHCHFTDGTPTGHMPWGLGERDMQRTLEQFERNHYQGGFSMEYVDQRSFTDPYEWDNKTLKQFERCIERLGGN